MADEVVEVPDADEMDDDTFLKHVDKRHQEHMKTEKALATHPHIQSAWVGAYRAYHEYLHRTEPDSFDHEHVWDDDEDG